MEGRRGDRKLAIECPRCGYELHGVMSAWRESCPTDGRCSECGLPFYWGEVLNVSYIAPRWNIEHALTLRAQIWAGPKTLLMMCRPWKFWSDLKMTHEPNWGRMIAYALIAPAILLYFTLAASVGYAVWSDANAMEAKNLILNVPPWIAGLRAVGMPFSTAPTVAGFWSRHNTPLDSAREYQFPISAPTWRSIGRGQDIVILTSKRPDTMTLAFQSTFMFLVAPVGFALLPVTRRICKVRWRHILRIAVYSLVLLVVPLGIDMMQQIAYWPPKYIDHSGVTLVIVSAAVLMVWWSAASSRYLRMPHAWVIGFSVVVLGYLIQWMFFGALDLAIDLMT